jgi:hypothetical protein
MFNIIYYVRAIMLWDIHIKNSFCIQMSFVFIAYIAYIIMFFRLNDDDVGSRIGSRQSLSPSTAEVNNVDGDVKISDVNISDDFHRRRVSDTVSDHKPSLLSAATSRRNTVTYDMNPAQNPSDIPFTDLVQQLIPPGASITILFMAVIYEFS